MSDIEILKRLYKDYTRKHLKKIILALLLSIAVAGSTSSIAYLLDPAIKEIFINKDQTMILIIPILIIIAFTTKGLSLYVAKVTMIGVSQEVRKDVQVQMLNNLIDADTKLMLVTMPTSASNEFMWLPQVQMGKLPAPGQGPSKEVS